MPSSFSSLIIDCAFLGLAAIASLISLVLKTFTDRYCGTQDIFYTIEGGEKFRYGGSNSPADSEIFKDEKLYEVDLEATDKLGNVSFKKIKFVVAKK